MIDWARDAQARLGRAPTALVTVLASEGSAPRGAGTRMVVTADEAVGTIGGGKLEHQAVEQARALLGHPPGTWRVQDYPLGPLLGQCCGGRVRLLVERLDPAGAAWLADAAPGATIRHRFEDGRIERATAAGVPETPSARGAKPEAGSVRIERLDPPGRPLLLFGAGHVGRAIALRAAGLPFALRWFDSRADAAERPGVAHVAEDAIDACAAEAPADAAILILTHDHGLDYRLVAAALHGPAAFVGLIGSATKRARFLSRLEKDGFDAAARARLTCPIGLPGIAGNEPEVIAIAALAQLLALRERGAMTLAAFRGEILAVPHDPLDAGEAAIVHHPDGLLVIEDGIVLACGAHAEIGPRFPAAPAEPIDGLIVPGFVDAHVHYPQVDAIAAHGGQLLDWLERHVFPAEAAFADRAHADAGAAFFLDELLRNGTTSALVFATVHEASVDALFEAALARQMRIVSGKVLMDLGPPALRDTAPGGRAASEALIARWRGRGRLGYAVTPRFALTSTDAQLETAGALLAAHPDVLLHTHLAENRAEVAAVAARFDRAADYLDVYDRFGLVGPRSVFAHCIHLEDRALARMAQARAGVAFCPTSNLFLGSGLFDLARADSHGLRIAIGTDVGAGTSFSLLRTLGEAYKVCQLRGLTLDPFRALHLATAGGAGVLGLAERIGGLLPGQEADFVVLDDAATPLLARRTAGRPLAERLFALQILGDDRAVARTYIAGALAHARDGACR